MKNKKTLSGSFLARGTFTVSPIAIFLSDLDEKWVAFKK